MVNRRHFLGMAGIATAAGLSACSRWMPPAASAAGGRAAQAVRHALNRLTFGPTPDELDRVSGIGVNAFLEEQLAPDSITDFPAAFKVRRIESLALGAPGVYDFTPDELIADLRRATILRAVYSRRQLFEVMVEFWNDHFNIYSEKADCGQLLVVHDREVIRRNAFGKFRDLVTAVAKSPAMLVYLDGKANVSGNPNENFARELLELHTLGVDGGYTQADVREASRALTGWRVREGLIGRGRPDFQPGLHDDSEKVILGTVFQSGNNLDRLIDLAASHPATSRHIALKLCRRFIGDSPPAAVVEKVADRFRETDGDIREVLREIIHSKEFEAAGPKFKRPFRYAVSVLRATNGDTDGGKEFQKQLKSLGHLPFDRPTPDGFPDGDNHWHAHILPRWNFAATLCAGGIKHASANLENAPSTPEATLQLLLGRPIKPLETSTFTEFREKSEILPLALCHPEFQYH